MREGTTGGFQACTFSREMCAPSLPLSGKDEWIACMRASLASLTPWLESVEARMTSETSGLRPLMSFGRFGHDGCFWKTSQDLFQTDSSAPSSVTWPASGTMQGGRCWALTTWAPRTGESGGGASQDWQTPKGTGGGNVSRGHDRAGELLLAGQAQKVSAQWPTPDACVMNDGERVESWDARRARLLEKHRNGNGAGRVLAVESCRFSRPHLTTPQGGSECSGDGPGSRRRWSTPNTLDGTDSLMETLEEWKDRNARKKASNPKLGELHLSLGTQAIREDKAKRLNPLFVEHLMGWPIGYSDSKRWATDRSRSVQRRRG